MIYKSEVQQKNASKLRRLIKEHDTPKFISDFFEVSNVQSEAAKLQYWSSIRRFLEWCLENHLMYTEIPGEPNLMVLKSRISQIEPKDLEFKTITFSKYFKELKDKGTKPSTISTNIKHLKSFCKYLYYNDYIAKDYIQGMGTREYSVKNFKTKKSKLATTEQLNEIIKNIEERSADEFLKERNLVIIKLFMNSGIRETELVGLNMGDVVLDSDAPYVNVVPKGCYDEAEKRKVYLTCLGDEVIDELRSLKLRRVFMGADYHGDDPLFITTTGERLTESSIYVLVTGNSEHEVTPHMIRHWYGTELYRKTKDLVFVKDQMGHASVDTTGAYYVSGYTVK